MDSFERHDGPQRTLPMSEEELAKLREMHRPGAPPARFSLVIFSRDGVRALSLVSGAHVVIGRSRPSEVTIRDESLSRQHAFVEVTDGEVWVEDLDSTNGTWVDGVRIERARLEPDKALSFGAVTAVVHAVEPGARSRPGPANHDQFLADLDVEVARARAFGRSLALLLFRADGSGSSPLSRWLPQIGQRLRPFDHVALYSGDTVEVMLPEAAFAQARDLAAKVVDAEAGLRCGLSVLPFHATSAEELVEVAREALLGTEVAEPIQVAGPSDDASPGPACEAGRPGPVVSSAAMKAVYRDVERVAASAIPVLIVGETGTGKEVVARAVHEKSPRREGPMVCFNCGAIPEQLVESILFGHEKGAFTGANQRTKGVFESAKGGTVLLDEVGELPLPAQAVLLRVLETKRFARVGSTAELEADVRVIAATHRDLEGMCAAKLFRQDLLFRLNVMTITVPPLRERPEEIEPLVWHFVDLANRANGCAVTRVEPEAMELLVRYAWPGNVRELRNAIERAVVISEGDVVTIADLPERLREWSPAGRAADISVEASPSQGEAGEINLRAEVERYEVSFIRKVLDENGWNRTDAARCLGLPTRTLRHKMRVHGIRRGE